MTWLHVSDSAVTWPDVNMTKEHFSQHDVVDLMLWWPENVYSDILVKGKVGSYV